MAVHSGTEPRHRKVSEIIADLASQPKDRVSLADLMAVLEHRAFGVLMLILALPNAVGLGTIPGLSTVFGVPQVLISIQMIFGAPRPWLPRWLAEKSIAMSDFRIMVTKAVPYLVKMERLLQPRLEATTSQAAERFLGVVFLILAVIVSLPIPFANQPPAVAQVLIALGLIERDGVFVLLGLVASLVALSIAGVVGLGIIAGIYLAIVQLFGF